MDSRSGALWCASAFFGAVVVGMFLFGDGAQSSGDSSSESEDAIAASGVSDEADLGDGLDLPAGWRVGVVWKSAGGWRQTGTATGFLDEVAGEVRGLMAAHGYVEARRVEGDEIGASQKLIQYVSKSGQKVMWMLWDIGGAKTGFAWGREK